MYVPYSYDNRMFLSLFSALFIPNGKITSLSELLWIVGVNNFVLKFVSVIIKILVILLPASVILHRKRVSYFIVLIINLRIALFEIIFLFHGIRVDSNQFYCVFLKRNVITRLYKTMNDFS